MDSQHNPSQPNSSYSLNDKLPLHSDASYDRYTESLQRKKLMKVQMDIGHPYLLD